MAAHLVHILCALTSLACAVLLGRAYKSNRVPLLWWSALCFSALALTNVLLFLDGSVFLSVDLMPLRNAITLLGLAALLYGLIFESA
ncbi:MAG: DUF5985 family protein [Verrucomicrobiota bacterium]